MRALVILCHLFEMSLDYMYRCEFESEIKWSNSHDYST